MSRVNLNNIDLINYVKTIGSVRVNTDRGVNTDGEVQITIKRNPQHVATNRQIP